MSILLINLRHAPDDEIADIRHLLDENEILYYVTAAGNWGVSAPGIWLKDAQQMARAKTLLDDYQQQRSLEQRAEYERLKQSGLQPTLRKNFFAHPLRVVLYGLLAAAILYFSIRPFFLL